MQQWLNGTACARGIEQAEAFRLATDRVLAGRPTISVQNEATGDVWLFDAEHLTRAVRAAWEMVRPLQPRETP